MSYLEAYEVLLLWRREAYENWRAKGDKRELARSQAISFNMGALRHQCTREALLMRSLS